MKVSETELEHIHNALNRRHKTLLMIDALATAQCGTGIKLSVSGVQCASASVYIAAQSDEAAALIKMLKAKEQRIRKELQEMRIDMKVKR